MAKKQQPQAQTPELFTVYYMNRDKVFEMRMLLDNRLQTGHTGEQTGSISGEANINAEAGAIVPFLSELQQHRRKDRPREADQNGRYAGIHPHEKPYALRHHRPLQHL